MNLRILSPLAGTLLIALCVSCASTTAQTSQAELPAPELTEVWTPKVPVVSAPPNGVPSDAIVLFNGQSLDEWQPVTPGGKRWKIEGDAMVIDPTKEPDPTHDQRSKREFGDIQLHLEFRTPAEVKGKGQGRGNSGVFFMGLYELQVLDSYDNETYSNGQVGSIYKQHIPLANPSRPPGEWQTYDLVFIAPRFAANGTLLSPARLTAFQNGVLVLHDVEIKGPTTYRGTPVYRAHADKLPLVLQDHRNPTAFRNIWVREIALPKER